MCVAYTQPLHHSTPALFEWVTLRIFLSEIHIVALFQGLPDGLKNFDFAKSIISSCIAVPLKCICLAPPPLPLSYIYLQTPVLYFIYPM